MHRKFFTAGLGVWNPTKLLNFITDFGKGKRFENLRKVIGICERPWDRVFILCAQLCVLRVSMRARHRTMSANSRNRAESYIVYSPQCPARGVGKFRLPHQ